MLSIVIAEAELELVPEEALNERCVIESAKKRGKRPEEILLDSSYHHSAKVCRDTRRGRPDIAHITLQVLQESLLNNTGGMRVFLHTRNDEVIYINPETRLPKNYNRFCGLIETLFRERIIVSEGRELMRMEKKGIEVLLEELRGRKVLLHQKGVPLAELTDREDTVAVIGGFPRGDFSRNYEGMDRASVADVELTTWATAMEVLCWYKTLK
jgi:rRNA small subunit pseudouridine methyltransferase Nep1